jgi:GDP-L-fucose synthase
MILVLGGNGFLGGRVCEILAQQGDDFVISSRQHGFDLRNKNHVDNLFKEVRPKYVLNCAADVGGISYGEKYPADMFVNNSLITINVLKYSNKYSVERIINPISNCSYPAHLSLFKEDEFWSGALHDSVLSYGFVKKGFWVGGWAYNKQFGLDVINLIMSNMYGPNDHFDAERSHALGALVARIVNAHRNNEEKVVVWGTGNPVREWLYVDDGAKALIKSIDIDRYIDPINIGVGKGISIRDLAYMISEMVGYFGEIEFDSSKQDGAQTKMVDGTRGRELMDWVPEISLQEGLARTIDWYYEKKVNNAK